MADSTKELAEFAENLWKNYFKAKMRQWMADNVSYYRARVITNNGNGTLDIQRPLESVCTVKCTAEMKYAEVGDEVLVLRFGYGNNNANHLVFAKGNGNPPEKSMPISIASTAITYTSSSSGTTIPTSGWQSAVPEVASGDYLWTRTTITYSNETTSNIYSSARQGVNGATGATGTSITAANPLYYASASATVPSAPTSEITSTSETLYATWTKKIPTYNSGYPYYYGCTQNTFSDGTFSWTNVVLLDNLTQEAEEEVAEVRTIATAAQTVANATANYFFADSDGTHVASVSNDATTGFNTLNTSTGFAIRNGTDVLSSWSGNAIEFYDDSADVVASFGQNITLQSSSDSGYCVKINPTSGYVSVGAGAGSNGFRFSDDTLSILCDQDYVYQIGAKDGLNPYLAMQQYVTATDWRELLRIEAPIDTLDPTTYEYSQPTVAIGGKNLTGKPGQLILYNTLSATDTIIGSPTNSGSYTHTLPKASGYLAAVGTSGAGSSSKPVYVNSSGLISAISSLSLSGAISGGAISGTSGTFSTTLNVTGAATLGDTLEVGSVATFNNGLAVDGLASLDAIDVTGGASIDSLSVVSSATIGTNLNVNGDVVIGGHDSPVGYENQITTSTAVSIATAAYTSIESVTLTTGAWVVTGFVRFASNSTGTRLIGLHTSSSSVAPYACSQVLAGSGQISLNTTRIINVTSAPKTFYLVVYQNSGEALNVSQHSLYWVRVA